MQVLVRDVMELSFLVCIVPKIGVAEIMHACFTWNCT